MSRDPATVTLSLKNRHTMVFGKKGEGKSNFVQWLLSEFPEYRSTLMYDTVQEHEMLTRYVPKYRKGPEAREELGTALDRFVIHADREMRPDLVAVEEVNRFAPNAGAVPPAVMELADLNRHYGVGFLGIARRPAQVDTDLVELADTQVFFYLEGDNDIKKLNRMKSGLGDLVNSLPEYHFVVREGRDVDVVGPVPEMDTTGEL